MTTRTTRRPSMEQFRDAILEDYRSEGVLEDTQGFVSRLFDVLICDLGMRSTLDFERDGLFERFHEHQAEKYMPRTQMTRMATLRKIAARGKKLGFLRRVPECPGPLLPRTCQFPRSDRTIPPPEGDLCAVRAYLVANSGRWHGCRIYCLTSIVDLSGVSLESAVRQRPHDVRLSDGFMVVCRGNSPPMHKPICGELRPALEKWLQVVDFKDWLFPADNRRGHWNPQVASKALKTTCIACGVRPFGFAQVLRGFYERSGRAASGTSIPPGISVPAGKKPALEIGSPTDRVSVFGVDHGVLPAQQYEVLRKISDGGEGAVFTAEDLVSKRVPYPAQRISDLMTRSRELRRLIKRTPGFYGSKATFSFSQYWDDQRG